MGRGFLVLGAAVMAAAIGAASADVSAQRPGMPGQGGPPQGQGLRGRGPGGPGGPAMFGLACGPANGGPGRAGRPGGAPPAGAPMPMMKDLQLTDDQAAAIERVTRDGCDASQPLAEQNGELRGALQAAILSDARDPGKIADLVARIGAIEQQLLDVHVRTHVAIADVLTAEQRAKLRAGK